MMERLPACELFAALDAGAFDEVIDVRSPAEFAEDHIPGSVNLPALSNSERAEIGEIYVQESKFEARKRGAAYVSRNIAAALETHLSSKPPDYRPLVLCWRGGMRSGAFALVLRQVGWRAVTLEGGYRAYRRRVAAMLHGPEPACGVVLIDGGTGSGKTALLRRLAARGRDAVDLEALAAHRGSVFGAAPRRAQPSQKMFESQLFDTLRRRKGDVLLVEAESSRIGDRATPPALWRAMIAAPSIVIDAPLAARATYLTTEYAEIGADHAHLLATLERLPERHGAARVGHWRELAQTGALRDLAEDLIATHYDPSYQKAARLHPRTILARIELEEITDAALEQAADEAEAALEAFTSA